MLRDVIAMIAWVIGVSIVVGFVALLVLAPVLLIAKAVRALASRFR